LDYSSLENIERKIKEIVNREKSIKKENEKMLVEGLLFPEDRFLFISLSEKLDKVINKINQSIRAMNERMLPLRGVNFLKDSEFKDYVDMTVKSIDKLNYSIEKLFSNSEDLITICNEVEELENKIDEIKLKILKELHKIEKDLDFFTILQIENIVHRIDEISDEAEDTSDIIILMKSLSLP
ncbi:MAG: DUF47 family protein, partial [Thermoplasmata archaeon]